MNTNINEKAYCEIDTEMPRFLGKLLLGFSVVFWATYFTTLAQTDISDFWAHIDWAKKFNFTYFVDYFVKVTSYPLWHFLTKACKVFLDTTWGNASSLVTATANGCSFLFTVFMQQYLFKGLNLRREVIPFWAVCLMFVGPLYIPRFNEVYHPGAGTGNIWHNPTSIMVKPFAILIFCVVAKIISTEKQIKRSEIIVLVVTLFLSALAKPSFIQGFIPGLGLYMVITLARNFTGERFKKYLLIASTFIPCVILMFFQFYISLFSQKRGSKTIGEMTETEMLAEQAGEIIAGGTTLTGFQQGVGFEWGRVYTYWTPNMYISFLLAITFPLFVFLFNYRKMIKDRVVQLALCFETAAWLEGAILYQKGPGEHCGNFWWASYLSLYIVFSIALYYFLDSSTKVDLKKKKNILYLASGSILFFMHLLFGLFYAESHLYIYRLWY